MTQVTELNIEQASQLVLGWLQSGGEAVAEQAPMLAEEIIRMGIYGNLIAGIASLVIGLVLLGVGAYLFRNEKSEAAEIFGVLGFVTGASFVLASPFYLYAIVKPVLAPRLYVLEELAKML